jgi:uncharacterized membrane protein YcaP (DUF421 family)
MTPFELILMFLMGGLSIQAVVADDRSLINAFLGVATIGLMHVVVAWAKQKSVLFRKLVDGTPIVIVEQGHWHKDRMHRMRLQDQDVMASARGKGLERAEQIDYAIVERNGEVTIFPKKNQQEQGSKAA